MTRRNIIFLRMISLVLLMSLLVIICMPQGSAQKSISDGAKCSVYIAKKVVQVESAEIIEAENHYLEILIILICVIVFSGLLSLRRTHIEDVLNK